MVDRLKKQALECERENHCAPEHYNIYWEDMRALLTEAAERIEGLEILVDQLKTPQHA